MSQEPALNVASTQADARVGPARRPLRLNGELGPRFEEAARSARRMEAVAELAGGIGHDMNNYLHIVTSSLETIQMRMRNGRTDGLENLIATALRSLGGAAASAKRLVTFAHAGASRMELVAVNTVMADMQGLLRSTLGRAIRLNLQFGRDLPRIRCDRHELENAVLNLAINARDAMPKDGILAIKTSVIAAADPASHSGYVSIRTSDTGHGMSPKVLARACEAFYTTKPAGQGTGLGLPMVRNFVESVGGRIEIDSVIGVGTRVTLLIPACPSEEAPLPAERWVNG
jgi:signal transduction histidine kinase